MSDTHKKEREERLLKLEELKKQGIDPYPASTSRSHKIVEVLNNFAELGKKGVNVTIVGRLRSKRGHGNLSFLSLEDQSGKIQTVVSKKDIGPENYKIITKHIDVGDFIEFSGTCFVTKKGEQSIMASGWKLLSKAIRPLPDKWHGLKDEEERLRKRYLEIMFDPGVKDMIKKKSVFWQAVREFMLTKGFLEVETPILEVTTGGADARPFSTHHNALDMDVFLRISMGELWQKKLMVAGFEKSFEIGRQFRNEGMDAEHLQDYTQMEFYWAYADYQMGMKLVEELFKYVAEETFETLKFTIGKHEVDLGKKWEVIDYQESVKKYTGIDILNTDLKEIEKKLKELKVEYDKKGFNLTRAIDNLWKHCRKQITGPGFLARYVEQIIGNLKRDADIASEVSQHTNPGLARSC